MRRLDGVSATAQQGGVLAGLAHPRRPFLGVDYADVVAGTSSGDESVFGCRLDKLGLRASRLDPRVAIPAWNWKRRGGGYRLYVHAARKSSRRQRRHA